MSPLNVGDEAPDFELPALVAGIKQRFRLGEQRGKRHIVLAFYPFNWEPISSKHMATYQVEREEFLARGAETVGICVESIMNTTAWEREIGPFDFPLCSDFWPHGDVAMKYGVLRTGPPDAGTSDRAVFLVDKNGKVAFRKLYGKSELPNVQDVLETLRRV
ncbi:MAG TPA: redoxin domain-containing protein [Terriglobales bacterium]|nr:redoxin domain-containing protein [Terriglobales bacterium]